MPPPHSNKASGDAFTSPQGCADQFYDNDLHTQNLRNQSIPVTDPSAGLRITEIFYSLQGEALTAGLPTIFIRLTGCPLRCVYCDTAYAFVGGERQSLEHIIETIAQFPCKRICVTGGEPLAQPNAIALMERLLNLGYELSLETAGALSVANVPIAVSKVMDLKTPSSAECDKNLWENLNYLTRHDQIKFVIMNRDDYDWAKTQVIKHKLHELVGVVWFSPMFNLHEDDADSDDIENLVSLNLSSDSHLATPAMANDISGTPSLAQSLAEWILADALPVRYQLQLHKIIWADAKGK